MYVFVSVAGSSRLKVFGPATPSECRAWMRLKGLHPGQVISDATHLIDALHGRLDDDCSHGDDCVAGSG